jgi:hypothetical protein
MLAEEKRVGSDPYWAGVNQRGKEFARRHGLKYVESPPTAVALHDQPAKNLDPVPDRPKARRAGGR